MTSSASTDTFPADNTLKMQRAADEPAPQWWRLNGQPALPADVAEVRRAAGITIAPEAALHRALQERTDELERVRRERDEARAALAQLTAPPTAPDVGSTTSAPAAGAADPLEDVPNPLTLHGDRRAPGPKPQPTKDCSSWARLVFGG